MIRLPLPARAAPPPAPLHLWAASLAVETGLLHTIAGQDHFQEWWGYGVFFIVVSLCQFIGGALLLFRSNRALYWSGIVGTAIVLAVWTASRTVGVHIGPNSAGPEPIGLLDALCTGLEGALILILIRLVRRPAAGPSRRVRLDLDRGAHPKPPGAGSGRT